MTRKATSRGREEFSADNWDSLTAVVPVKMVYCGSRAVLPYALSFLTSRYWTQRVAYSMTTHEIGGEGGTMRQVDCLQHAGQALIVGPENLLLVVLDVEVHPGERVRFGIGGKRRVDVLGRSARAGPGAYPTVREAIVDAWLGGQMTRGVPPGGQRDAYEALAILNSLVGTQGVYDTALNLATELWRGFHLGACMSSNGRKSQGLLCYGADMSSGRRFGAGGPRGKVYSWDDADTVSREIEWAKRFVLSPSGMLAEAMGVADGYEGGVWPHAQTFACNAFSIAVSSTDFDLRIARALQLIEPGTPSIVPRHERFWC
ncbi:hypothetical protein HPB51_012284 [Rhipicephalus microplus]|uniref:Uncharacterized protein n=1 Tax=Rhipicephalus microplus TaxID=6941 RepID=A0A9J6E0J0_RHIMP|nr:hypothetical protein HPB51_012284 [Rhipicephalus microplus]